MAGSSKAITWDDGQIMTCGFLGGEIKDISVLIESADSRSIQRRSANSAKVKLKSGQTLILKGVCGLNDQK